MTNKKYKVKKFAIPIDKNLFNVGGFVYDSNYGVSDLTKSPILGGMMAARTVQPIFDYNLEKISDVPIIDTTNNISSNYFSDPSSIARPTYAAPSTSLPDKIDVKVGGKSLAEGPLTNQELGIKPKTDWNSIANKGMAGLSGVMNIAQSTMANAKIKDTAGIQTAIDAAANTTFGGSTNEQLLAQYDAIENLDRTSQRDLTGSVGSKLANTGKATLSGVQAGMQIGGPIGGIIGGAAGLIASGIGWAVGDTKAQNEAERLNREAAAAEQRRLANFNLAVNNLEQQNLMYDMANYAKYGGKINIKPSKRGTFTRAAKSRGLGVQEFASKVLANPDDYSEAMRKKAQFAKNASKWKHDDGGFMESYANPSTVTGAVAKGTLQLLDPTGISSYPDVYYSGKELLNNPSWENAGMFGLNVIGALPLIGKVSAPFKAAKTAKLMSRIGDASAIIKAAGKVGDANKVIDTLPELIPITRNAAAKTQDITTSLISDPLFQMIRPDNKLDVMRAFRAANAAVDVTNAANNSADIVGIVQDIKDSNKKADGGPLFNEFSNVITKINEGGSHEFITGQEYDVTEEEIKLLKNLGYEFEYI